MTETPAMQAPLQAIVILALAVLLGALHQARGEKSQAGPPVKMSRYGVCHEAGTVHYTQTIYFEPFDSLEACLAAGGRRMGEQPAANAPPLDYRGTHPFRLHWGHLIAGAIIAAAFFFGIIRPLYRRWKGKRQRRAFEERQKRLWQGHRLESRSRRK